MICSYFEYDIFTFLCIQYIEYDIYDIYLYLLVNTKMKMMILSTIGTILGLRPQSNHRFVTQIQGWTNCLIFYIFVSSLIPRKVHVSSFNHSYHFQPLASFPWVWSAFLSFLVSLFSFPAGINHYNHYTISACKRHISLF